MSRLADTPRLPELHRLSTDQIELGLLGLGGVIANPAPGLVGILCPEHDQVIGADDTLGVHARATALVADGKHLGHVLGLVTQGGDRLEWSPQIVGVETRDDHLFPRTG